MNVTAVESTTIATVAYDEDCAVLQLEFRSQAIYQYFGVPTTIHEGLLRAPSKGSIRGCFPYRLVSNIGIGRLHESVLPERSR